jgi:CMP-N,N'-diacetyllegionaminic acid synthase
LSLNDYSILAVVPARGGSKGIPRKNLQRVAGLSLVARAARVALSLDWIDAAIISTDDLEMAEEGRRHGLDAPFMRPGDLAGDTALGIDVWRHAWIEAEKHYNRRFDLSVKLEPTSPLRRPEDVELTVRTVIEGGYPAAATVSPTPAHYSPHKTLTVSENGIIGFYLEDGAKFCLRQSIPQYYHRNGICYAAIRRHVVDQHMIVDRDAAAVIIERPVVNIDEPFELELAEWLLNRENKEQRSK